MADASSPAAVIQRARLQGLITGNPCKYWQVNDGAITHALARQGLRWPTRCQDLAIIMLGLGELSARCHAKLWPHALPHLAKRAAGREDSILAEAFAQTLATARSVSLGDHSAAQLLTSDRLSWGLLASAKSLVGHPWDVASTPRYGLQSVIRFMLSRKPEAIATIRRRYREHPLTASVVRASIDHLIYGEPERVLAAARTKCPLLIALAAARIAVEPPAKPSDNASRFEQGRRLLVEAGVASVDATCLMMLHFKEAVHQRFRLTYGIRDTSVRVRWLESQTPPLSPSDAHDMTHLPNRLDELRAQAERHEKAVDRLLDDIARHWPQAALSDDQLALIEPTFVDSEELRYRLAKRMTMNPARSQLLQLNLDAWKSDVGLNLEFDAAFAEVYYPRVKDLVEKTLWAARSFIALRHSPKGGVGREVGLLIERMKKAADQILSEPYMAARQPTRWQSALLRSAGLAIFALFVVAETPSERRTETDLLAGFALDHAREVLIHGEAIGARWDLLDTLASVAIWRMAQDSTLAPRLSDWANTVGLPTIVRAMAAWSSETYVDFNANEAINLFIDAGIPPIFHRGSSHEFNRLMSLLDIAAATTARSQKQSHADALVQAWSEVIGKWPEQMRQWQNAADWLIQAVRSTGSERDALLRNAAFENSYCRRVIDVSN